MERKAFIGGKWENEIDVRDFIQRNYTLYQMKQKKDYKI